MVVQKALSMAVPEEEDEELGCHFVRSRLLPDLRPIKFSNYFELSMHCTVTTVFFYFSTSPQQFHCLTEHKQATKKRRVETPAPL